MKGFTPKNCALFCAHPPSKTIADGSSRAGKRIARNGAKNQHDSKPSHSVLIVFGRSLNQPVAEFSFCTPSAPCLTYPFKQTWTKSLGPCFAYGLLGPSVLLASVGSINKPRLFAAKCWPLGATWALLQRHSVEIAMHVVVQGSRQFWLRTQRMEPASRLGYCACPRWTRSPRKATKKDSRRGRTGIREHAEQDFLGCSRLCRYSSRVALTE